MESTETILSVEKFATSTFPPPTLTAETGVIFEAIRLIRNKTKTEQLRQFQAVPLTDFVAYEFSQIREVDAVLTARHNNLFYVWIIVDQFDKGVREKVYSREKEIINGFKQFDFDFNIISRRGRDMNELISDPMMTLTFKREQPSA